MLRPIDEFDGPEDFESLVWLLLRKLADEQPKRVSVKRHPVLSLANGQSVIPDFELTTELPHQTDHRLIECQDRLRSSQDVLHKIRSVRAISPRNRFIFLYRNRQSISNALTLALNADGVVHYDIYEFAVFLEELSGTIEKLDSPPRETPLAPGRYLGALLSRQEGDSRRLNEVVQSRSWHKDEGMLGRR